MAELHAEMRVLSDWVNEHDLQRQSPEWGRYSELQSRWFQLNSLANDLAVPGSSGDWVDRISCEQVQAIVAKLGHSRTLPPKTQVNLPSAAQQMLNTFGPAAAALSDKPLSRVWKHVYELYEKIEKVEKVRTVVSFLVNPSPETSSELVAMLGEEAIPQASIPIEIVTRLGKDTIPAVYKALFDEVMQVMADPSKAAAAQRTFLERVQGELLKAYSLGIIEPSPEAARAAKEQDSSLPALTSSFGAQQGVRAYLRAALDPASFADIRGTPDPAIKGPAHPERLTLDVPLDFPAVGVDLYGKGATDARVVSWPRDGVHELAADLNQDGRIDWLEIYDENDAAWARSVDTNADGKADLVYERVGGAEHFTHVYLDSNCDGRFDSVAESSRGDGTFDRLTSDANGDGRADTIEIRGGADNKCVILRDGNGDGKTDVVLVSGIRLLEDAAARWTASACDANGNGYFERLTVGFPDCPPTMEYLDPDETGMYRGLATAWETGGYRGLFLDADGDGICEVRYRDDDLDGRFDRVEPASRSLRGDHGFVGAALQALLANEGWVTPEAFPKLPR